MMGKRNNPGLADNLLASKVWVVDNFVNFAFDCN